MIKLSEGGPEFPRKPESGRKERFRTNHKFDLSKHVYRKRMAGPIPSLPGIGSALVGFLIVFIIYLLIMGFVLYLAGKVVVGRRVTFGEAIAVAAAATFLVTGAIILLAPFIGLFAYLIGILIFLGLVKRYFRTGWLAAIGVGIMAIVVAIILIFVLGLLALGALLALPSLPKFPFSIVAAS